MSKPLITIAVMDTQDGLPHQQDPRPRAVNWEDVEEANSNQLYE